MSSLSQARTTGSVGSILVLFAFVMFDGAALFVAGFILVLIAISNLSSITEDKDLNGSTRTAVVLYAVGTLVGFLYVYRGFPSLTVSGFTGPLVGVDPLGAFFARFAGTRIVGLIATWFFFVVASFFLKKPYDSIALRFKVDLFRTAGMVLLIGAVMLIVFGAGLIILFLGATLQTAAFLSLEESQAQ